MKYIAPLILCASAASLAVPLGAAPGGRLTTLPHGDYVCSLPGDAGGAAWRPIENGGFTIDNASTYRTVEGSGTYLVTGKQVRFTRGPMKGKRFMRTGSGSLEWVDKEGKPGNVRCVRTGGTG